MGPDARNENNNNFFKQLTSLYHFLLFILNTKFNTEYSRTSKVDIVLCTALLWLSSVNLKHAVSHIMGIFLIKCPQYNRSHDSCWISFASLSFPTNISFLENVCLIIFTNKAIVDSRLRLLRRRKIEPRPYAACTKNLVKIASVVPEISSRRDRHRDT